MSTGSGLLKDPLEAPDVQALIELGLNAFALKLVAESAPDFLTRLAGQLDLKESHGVSMVMTSKNGTRVRLTIALTDDEPTPGQGAL